MIKDLEDGKFTALGYYIISNPLARYFMFTCDPLTEPQIFTIEALSGIIHSDNCFSLPDSKEVGKIIVEMDSFNIIDAGKPCPLT
jgi:hypothetical protein